jgi:hypothetical protein
MKKTLLLTVALFITAFVYSQNPFEPETYFGIKLGGNISGILSDSTISQKINPGLTGGLVFKNISEKSFGIQIELNYQQSGWNENLDSANTYKRRLNFIKLPFMTHVNLGNQKTRFVINFGPYISYLLSEKEKINLLDGHEEKEYYGHKIDNKVGYGLCLGLGISRRTSIGLFQVESRISSSLTNIFKSSADSLFFSSKDLNVELSLSYMIDCKNLKKSSKRND